MPLPLSSTVMVAKPSPAMAESRMRPPSPVYLEALFSRLATTCERRAKSPSSHTGRALTSTERRCSRASIIGRTVSTLCATILESSTVSRVQLSAYIEHAVSRGAPYHVAGNEGIFIGNRHP